MSSEKPWNLKRLKHECLKSDLYDEETFEIVEAPSILETGDKGVRIKFHNNSMKEHRVTLIVNNDRIVTITGHLQKECLIHRYLATVFGKDLEFRYVKRGSEDDG